MIQKVVSSSGPLSGGALGAPVSPTRARSTHAHRSATRRALPRLAILAVILAGCSTTVALLRHVGWRAVVASLASLGTPGLLVFCVATLGVLALLGYAWFVLAPNLAVRHLGGFVFGRVMREAAVAILPFSQVGGFIAGARAAGVCGAPPTAALATSVVDLGAEMMGQLLFTALGVLALSRDAPGGYPHRLLDPILAAGLGVGVVTAALFMAAQRGGFGLLSRSTARWAESLSGHAAAVQACVREVYAQPLRVVASVALHLAAWLFAAGGVWLVLTFMHTPLSYSRVVELESLIYLLRSAAFFVPGAIGVLEGGYVLLGPVFGLSAEAALGLSLAKRARDFAIGLPAVLTWQILEGRGLLGRRKIDPTRPS